ncbi:MAG: copper transporter [Nocardioides sp.]|nr:copper transporter [Nocardioides sp.]
MISLRHHLLTIVAVFLALATGIVLGGGPLSDVGARVTSVATEQTTPAPDPGAASTTYGEAFATAVAPGLVAGTLADRQVAVVTVPGADEQLVTALTDEVAAAGGSVSGRYALTPDMVDPAQKSLVDTLGSQLMTQQAARDIPAESSTYDRMGHLLGIAIATKKPGGDDVTGKARGIIEAISGAALVLAPDGVERQAPLVLVVLGTDAGDPGSDAILTGLGAGLAAAGVGVVVSGTTADGDAGQLARFRADPVAASVASVDGIDTTAGRVATIRTLARSLTTPGGAFGASGADGPLPLG